MSDKLSMNKIPHERDGQEKINLFNKSFQEHLYLQMMICVSPRDVKDQRISSDCKQEAASAFYSLLNEIISTKC